MSFLNIPSLLQELSEKQQELVTGGAAVARDYQNVETARGGYHQEETTQDSGKTTGDSFAGSPSNRTFLQPILMSNSLNMIAAQIRMISYPFT